MLVLARVNTKCAPIHGNMNPSTSPALARKSRALSGACAMPGGDFQLKVPARISAVGSRPSPKLASRSASSVSAGRRGVVVDMLNSPSAHIPFSQPRPCRMFVTEAAFSSAGIRSPSRPMAVAGTVRSMSVLWRCCHLAVSAVPPPIRMSPGSRTWSNAGAICLRIASAGGSISNSLTRQLVPATRRPGPCPSSLPASLQTDSATRTMLRGAHRSPRPRGRRARR